MSFLDVLDELASTNFEAPTHPTDSYGNLTGTVFETFYRVSKLSADADQALVRDAISQLCDAAEVCSLEPDDIERIAKLAKAIRTASFKPFLPVSQQVLLNADNALGSSLIHRTFANGMRYSALFVPIECQTLAKGKPIGIERLMTKSGSGESRVKWMKFGKIVYDSVRNYANQGFTFSAGMPGLYDARYVDFKRATASNSQAINSELATAFSEQSAMPLYFLQSLICVRASVWTPTFKHFRELLIKPGRPYRNMIFIDGMTISTSTTTHKLYLNTVSEDDHDQTRTANVFDTKLDFTKFLEFCRIVYAAAADHEVPFSQVSDDDNDDDNDDNHDDNNTPQDTEDEDDINRISTKSAEPVTPQAKRRRII
eukprot:scaffold4190_cov153-Pinguiococcus_pyrenoidosus.AAC.1